MIKRTSYVHICSTTEVKDNDWGIELYYAVPEPLRTQILEHLQVEDLNELPQISEIISSNGNVLTASVEEIWSPEAHLNDHKIIMELPVGASEEEQKIMGHFGCFHFGYLLIGDQNIPVVCDQNAAPVGLSFNPVHIPYIEEFLKSEKNDLNHILKSLK